MTQKTSFYNYVIAGAGASGLLLALEMNKSGVLQDKTLCIIEKNIDKQNDRTWCFWTDETPSQIINDSISHQWETAFSGSKYQKLSPYTYNHIRSSEFYQQAWSVINQNVNIVKIFTNIEDYEERDNLVHITTLDGIFSCEYFFNSAIISKEKFINKINLWQSFYGYRVKFHLEINLDFKLMDFDVIQSDYTQFIYQLPFSKNEALIELTRFGRVILKENEAEDILKNYIKRFSNDFQIIEKEINAIPMSQVFDSKNKHHSLKQRAIPIGITAGALKSTTGYGFLQMQDHACKIVESLLQNNAIPTISRKKRFVFYDSILLHILEKQPAVGKKIFEILFKKNKINIILKFLDEKTNLLEEIKIFKTLPKLLFIKHLILSRF